MGSLLDAVREDEAEERLEKESEKGKQKDLSIPQMLRIVKLLKLKKGEYITINGLRVAKT